MESMDLMAMLQHMQNVAALHHPIATHQVSLGDITTVPREGQCDLLDRCRGLYEGDYSVSSYPTAWLFGDTLERVRMSLAAGSRVVELPNGCCNRENCPQMVFRRIVLRELAPRALIELAP